LKPETDSKIKKHFLYPSSIIVSAEPCEITTILGSCVAVCIFDPLLAIGGINHYILPLWNGVGLESPKYGNIAIEKLIIKLVLNGSNRKNLRAKIFGGSEMMQYRSYLVGKRNIEIAEEMLKGEGIPILASSVGGKLGRKIIFNTETGEVRLFFIPNNNGQTLS
jgi:chemotaxis protein CheD